MEIVNAAEVNRHGKDSRFNDSQSADWIALRPVAGRKRSNGEFPAVRFRIPRRLVMEHTTYCALVTVHCNIGFRGPSL